MSEYILGKISTVKTNNADEELFSHFQFEESEEIESTLDTSGYVSNDEED